ncbi:hypothetical protein SAMN02745857_03617 [Andreprevotia lacus DSM 23236]|jgi:hypothetical protein|uniref:Tat (Twin-arginine translocation) pathway signal sequence n=1 Tax=Andreprevotia lacus DSM 23236 TaxID=1121001 RepID=A0A1W1XYS8_9NEIS|nr:hypothetical protein [Andreprevotia lacus]SMC29119.1 hypothetical protein SAMN02745857_03617 [Andreprevotia lacus DSM 23236]
MNPRRRTLLKSAAALLAALGAGAYALHRQQLSDAQQARLDKARQQQAIWAAHQDEWNARVAAIQRFSVDGMIARDGLDTFMRYWSAQVVQRLRRLRTPLDALQQEIVHSGSLFYPPASAGDIAAVQDRLQLRLPPGMLALLARSDGIKDVIDCCSSHDPGSELTLQHCARFDWLHRVNKELVDIWTRQRDPVPDSDYNVYGPQQAPELLRVEYLQRIVAISNVVDGGVYLLNPHIVFPDGEMEVWDFSPKYPGAVRYRSLYALLEAVCRDDCHNLELWDLDAEWQQKYGVGMVQ